MVKQASVTLRLAPPQIDDLARKAMVNVLGNPDTWDEISNEIGPHSSQYDLYDPVHRRDVVQIVCAAIVRRLKG